VALYVDDLIIACSNQDLCNKLEKIFADKFKMKILDKINHFLRMDVKVNVTYQQQYVKNTNNTFKEYGMYNYTTPMDSRVHLSKAMSPAPGSEDAEIMKEIPCRELIESLLWIANGTRPDISYPVSTLAKYTTNPGMLHWKDLLRVLGHLCATQEYCIKYKRNEAVVVMALMLEGTLTLPFTTMDGAL
jgi:hypothetical protein